MSKLATSFLVFEGLFFGSMMAFAYLAPLDFVSGVLEIPKEELSSILATNLDNSNALVYTTFTTIDNDNCHGMVVFMALIAFHTALKVEQKDRTWIFASFFVAHALIVWNQTKALNGNYYVQVDIDAATKLFEPARILHSFFALSHVALAIKNVVPSGEAAKTKRG